MPITFKSKYSPDILMLETTGRELIRLMGHSGALPGSLAADDIPAALARLEAAVKGQLVHGREGPAADDRNIRLVVGELIVHGILICVFVGEERRRKGDVGDIGKQVVGELVGEGADEQVDLAAVVHGAPARGHVAGFVGPAEEHAGF